jgi:hypothetical protein
VHLARLRLGYFKSPRLWSFRLLSINNYQNFANVNEILSIISVLL